MRLAPSSPIARAGIVVACVTCLTPAIDAARLDSRTAAAWTACLSAIERRIAGEVASPTGFLGLDFDRSAIEERRVLRTGAIVVREVDTVDAGGTPLDMPYGRLHHWRGDVLIGGITLAPFMKRLREGVVPPDEEVLRSQVLARTSDGLKMYLRLQRTSLVTVVYDTEHLVTFASYGRSRAASTATATKIAELADAGTPRERELPVGDDRGFLWRLSAFWRYEEADGGVIAECESLALSRNVPSLLRLLADPLIDRTARESMTHTLAALRAYFETQ